MPVPANYKPIIDPARKLMATPTPSITPFYSIPEGQCWGSCVGMYKLVWARVCSHAECWITCCCFIEAHGRSLTAGSIYACHAMLESRLAPQ